MKRFIRSADYVQYNANNRGTRTGDCVKRALSLAFDMSYSDIGKLLNEKMKEKRVYKWNIPSVYKSVAKELGASAWIDVTGEDGKPMKLSDWVDNYADSSKTYLVHTGPLRHVGEGYSVKRNHIVCVRDGKVWDSWDSRNEYVDDVSEIQSEGKQIAKKIELGPIAFDIVEPTIQHQIEAYAGKRS